MGRHLDKEVDAIVPKANGKTQVTCGYYNKRILPFVEKEIQKDLEELRKDRDALHKKMRKLPNKGRPKIWK